MEVAFEIEFDGRIWDSAYEDNIICLETKNTEAKKTTFHLVDLKQVDIISSFHSPLDEFFCGLDTYQNKQTIVHGFDQDQNILTKGVSIHDLHGEVLFTSPDYLFEMATPEVVLLTDKDQQLLKLEHNIPTPLTSPIELDEVLSNGTITPIHYTAEDPHFQTIHTFLVQKFQHMPLKGLDYLEHDGKIIISFYLSDGNALRNLIYVLNEHGELIFEDILDEKLTGIGINTFFVIENRLYYIKSKNLFVGVDLI